MNRRRFLKRSAGAAAIGIPVRGFASTRDPGNREVFQHGVASGDPLRDGVIIWTRVTSMSPREEAVDVQWVVTTDSNLNDVVARGQTRTHAGRDYTVKVDVRGLEPGSRYYYGFQASGQRSPVGRTRTAPDRGDDAVSFAVASCANYPLGYFNVYRRIAEREDLNAVIHLGDYLYEYPASRRGDEMDLRRHLPGNEIVSLTDYRLRHAQYKSDPDLQAAHRAHPWVCVWDDHESANNSWMDGAQNHDPDEGEWAVRKAAAVQAYHEWMPIRAQPMSVSAPRIFRGFRFGNTVDLLMLDTRLHGRSRQVRVDDSLGLADPSRTLLGAEQMAWFKRQLTASDRRGACWRVIGNQCMFGQLLGEGRSVLNTDQWDGYPLSRQAVIDHLQQGDINDNVIVTGDLHSSWALDISPDPFSDAYGNGGNSVAVELVASSVTSLSRYNDASVARPQEQEIVAQLPHMKWVNLTGRGYVVASLTPQLMRAEWWLVNTVADRQHEEYRAAAYVSERGSNRLEAV